MNECDIETASGRKVKLPAAKKLNFQSLVPVLLMILFFLSPLYSQEKKENNMRVEIDEQLGAIIPLDLSFKNSDGKEVKLRDLITKPTVLSLVYYHCPTVCKPLLGGKVDVLDRLDMVPGKDYNALTISFNDKETPEKAKNIKNNFIKRFNMDFPEGAWHFLTGDEAGIRALTNSLGFYFRRNGEDFIHPSCLIMLSPTGKVTRYFNGTSYLPFDIKLGFLEASEGKIGPTISKILLYCFSYDPEGKRYVFNILKVTATVTIFFGLLFVIWLVISTRKKRKEK
ncbi:MAG: SCO family protein [bacterium]|nr:SCO family protein [bacterium]